jgi:hypothetical protein
MCTPPRSGGHSHCVGMAQQAMIALEVLPVGQSMAPKDLLSAVRTTASPAPRINNSSRLPNNTLT